MDDFPCTATPYSSKPYYPYLLANGNDAVLVNYSGAMVCGVSGHIHTEQHQNSVLAWYKQEHRHCGCAIAPIIISGYQVIIDDEVCAVSDFVQHFDPRCAELESIVSFRCGVKLRVLTYLTDSGVLAYELEVLASQAEKMSIIFTLLAPYSYRGTGLFESPAPEIKFSRDSGEINYTYLIPKSGTRGAGALRCDRSDGEFCENSWGVAPGLKFDNVTTGWRGKMFTLCADEPAELPEIPDDLRQQHEAAWNRYFSTSDIRIPDAELQHFYELSRYVTRIAQHKNGGIVCGLLPHMWDGGTCCPADAAFTCQAFVQMNNLAEGRRHLQFYLDQYDAGVELVKSFGIKGTAFSNWSNVFGEHCSRDISSELMKRKPIMIAIIGIAAGEYCLYTDGDDVEAKKLLHGCADFIESGFVHDGLIASTVAGNESYLEVSRDSFMLAVTIRVLELDAQLNDHPQRAKIAAAMREQLELNRDEHGVILPWANARYYSAMPIWCQLHVRGIHTVDQLKTYLNAIRTPWGTDGEQPSEVARDWSWNNPIFAKLFIREGDFEQAFSLLEKFAKNSSSTGAIPEQIRLDGFVIGYWYQTVYAIFLLALSEAFAWVGDDTLYLLYGLDGKWRDFSVKNLRVQGNTLISMTVKDGVVTELDISGKKPEKIVINPKYSIKKICIC